MQSYDLGPTSLGISPKLAAALAYIPLVGLIFLFLEKQNRFIREHSAQSMALWALSIVLSFSFRIFDAAFFFVKFIRFGIGIFSVSVSLALFVIWIICVVNAATGKWFRLPVLGDLAIEFVDKII